MTIAFLGPGFGRAEAIQELAWSDRRVRPNPGLLFERFLHLTDARRRDRRVGAGGSEGQDAEPSEIREAIETFAGRMRLVGQKVVDPNHGTASSEPPAIHGQAILAEWHQRLDRFGTPLGAEPPADFHHFHADAVLRTPLIVGGGEAHAFENGLTFHATLGVPYLPGTALKGVAREWAELSGQLDVFREALGIAPGGNDAALQPAMRGELVFLEALPYGVWPRVEPDIINVHLREYYGANAGEGRNPEAVPFESPTPVFLPVVAATAEGDRPLRFRFRVGATTGNAQVARKGLMLLLEALEWIGVGAKTSVGYGMFERVDEG